MLNRLIKYKKLKEKEENYNNVNYGDPQLFEKCAVSKIKITKIPKHNINIIKKNQENQNLTKSLKPL